MTTTTETQTQVHEVEIDATPEQVWAALTTSEWTQRYGYGGRVEYDLQPGGGYRAFASQAMLDCGSPELVVEGEVLEAAAPHRLVQTWDAQFDAAIAAEPAGRLTIEIQPVGRRSRLTLAHELEGSPITAAIVGGHVPQAGGGWRFVLDDLKRVLEEDPALAA